MRLNHTGRNARPERGAVAVEFALVLPLFLLLIFGLTQYGWYFFQVQETAFAVREGSRVAAVGTADAQEVCELVGGKMVSTATATVFVTASGDSVGDQITVRATRNATNFNLPFVPFPSSIQSMDQSAITRTENVDESNTSSFNGDSWSYDGTTKTCS